MGVTMTELVESTDREEMIGSMTTDIVDQKEFAEQLLEQAKEQNRAGRSRWAVGPVDRARDRA